MLQKISIKLIIICMSFIDSINMLGQKAVSYFFCLVNIFEQKLSSVNDFLTSYVLVLILIAAGVYLTIYYKFPHQKILQPKKSTSLSTGISAQMLFWSMMGGSIGLGNIIFMAAAVIKGGPLTIIALWIGCFFGIVLQYSEIFLCLKYRTTAKNNDFIGGSLFLIKKAFTSPIAFFLSIIFEAAILLYAIEVYQFSSIMSISRDFLSLSDGANLFVGILLAFSVVSIGTRIKYVTALSAFVMPIFLVTYLVSSFLIIKGCIQIQTFSKAISIIGKDLSFTLPAIGIALYRGISTALYSGDVCTAYGSIIQTESNTNNPAYQARLCVLSLISDNLVCTLTGIVILFAKPIISQTSSEIDFVRNIFIKFVPFGHGVFFTLVLMAGYTTVCGYSTAGQKIAKLIGHRFYVLYCVMSFLIFVLSLFLSLNLLQNLMAFCLTVLVTISVLSILKLRKEVKFS